MTRLNSVSLESAQAAVSNLIAAREEARLQAHQFSTETWRSWRELEHEIDNKLEEVEHRLAQGGLFLAETVSARASDLCRAVDLLLQEHSHPQVRAIMTPEVNTCRPEDTLDTVARLLWEFDCGAAPVLDAEGALVGMITDRDICMAAFTRNKLLSECTVASTMARQVHSCTTSATLSEVADIMRAHRVRRVPVLAPTGRLAGIVSVADLARYLNSLPEEHTVRAILVPTLASITRP
jgi:CBS domain-containing protein